MTDVTPTSDLDRFKALSEHFPGLTQAMIARTGLHRVLITQGLAEKTFMIVNDKDGREILAGRLGLPLEKDGF